MRLFDVIRGASRRDLQDVDWLAEAIAGTGLTEFSTTFENAGVAESMEEMRLWQYAGQLAPYLIKLSGLSILSYMEIGVFQGGTFALTCEYLRRFEPLEKAVAVDVCIHPAVRLYAAQHPEVELVEMPSAHPQVEEALSGLRPPRLVLIDAVHEEPAVQADWEIASRHADYVAFHDICEHSCPDVKKVWDRARGRKWAWEQQPGGNSPTMYGIGLIKTERNARGRKAAA